MSDVPLNNRSLADSAVYPTNRPEHHFRNPSEPLPGARGAQGAQSAADFNQDAMGLDCRDAMSSSWDGTNTGPTPSADRALHDQKKTAFNADRPLNVQPAGTDGVAIGGREDLPMGHAGIGDKIVGKTQKVAGKMTGNTELHERGELRESGGKAAAHGDAHAPHD